MSKCCVGDGCRIRSWADSPFCFGHLIEHITQSLPDNQRSRFYEVIDSLLKTITYREREVLKLRYGLSDRYTYTHEEIGRIFKVSSPCIRYVEKKALQTLLRPTRFTKLSEFLDIYQFGEPSKQIISAVQLCESELIADVTKHPEHLREVSPNRFERIIAEIMNGLGFQVHLTPKTKDGGCDIIALTSDHVGVTTKYIVECKRYAADRPIRVELVRSLYGVKQQKRADHAMLVTTSYFTADAVKFCNSPEVWNLHLKDFEAIKKWLETYDEMIRKGAVLL
jgi:restriction endonuclease Mrr